MVFSYFGLNVKPNSQWFGNNLLVKPNKMQQQSC